MRVIKVLLHEEIFSCNLQRNADESIAKQVVRGCQTFATIFAWKAIALLVMFKLDPVLEEEIEMKKKKQRTTWARSGCVRWEAKEHCSTFSATCSAIFRCDTSCEERVLRAHQ